MGGGCEGGGVPLREVVGCLVEVDGFHVSFLSLRGIWWWCVVVAVGWMGACVRGGDRDGGVWMGLYGAGGETEG